MRKFLCLALLAAAPAMANAADKVFFDGRVAIVFHSGQPCEVPRAEVEIAKHDPVGAAQAATVVIHGRRTQGCWAFDGDGDYIVIDERGSGGVIFARAVKEPKGSI